jgi:NADP-dependent 3-hydroxy acid dehydrogenase YdfG
MRRKILMVLLATGAVAGFGAGFARAYQHGFHGHGPGRWGRHAELERRVAETCTDAALRVYNKQAGPGTKP